MNQKGIPIETETYIFLSVENNSWIKIRGHLFNRPILIAYLNGISLEIPLAKHSIEIMIGKLREIQGYNQENNLVDESGCEKIIVDSRPMEDVITEIETKMIRRVLAKHNNDISKTAKELGLTRRGLYLKMERYGIN